MLTLGEQQVPATVRPAAPGLVASGGSSSSSSGGSGAGPGQALEVQLPQRILLVRDMGGSTAQLVRTEVDGEPVSLQVLDSGPRQLKLQHCGAHRVVQVRMGERGGERKRGRG